MKRIFLSPGRMLIAAVAAFALVLGLGATSASADDGLSPFNKSILVPDYTEMLWSLVGSQSDEQIDRIANSGHEVQLLLDPKAGKILAAIDTESTFTPSALTRLGPGCSTDSLCMLNSVPNGYIGTGSLYGTWSNVYKYMTGDRIGTFQFNGLNWTHNPRTTVNLPDPEKIVYIARQ
ncbi:hypothetical protein ABZ671_11865 [Micromonospora sp. NPDC006766]|uniref:hypothetical protein n=1 Tax=Micromonospora sp. NPDC006766 TaxID=3154778 RepID=UPI0033D9E4E6